MVDNKLWEFFEEELEKLWERTMPYKDVKYDYDNNIMTVWNKDGTITTSPIFVEMKNR